MAAALILFRVHFDDGVKIDVTAASAAAAGKQARAVHDGRVAKIKQVKS